VRRRMRTRKREWGSEGDVEDEGKMKEGIILFQLVPQILEEDEGRGR
jgi:hypothetical protein